MGEIITFYSYKGGTGRSMALANIAHILAWQLDSPNKVLAIDWDLEAPGLHKYFVGQLKRNFPEGLRQSYEDRLNQKPGLIDFLYEVRASYQAQYPSGGLGANQAATSTAIDAFNAVIASHSLSDYILTVEPPAGFGVRENYGLSLIKAGNQGPNTMRAQEQKPAGYVEHVRGFDWVHFHENYGSFFTLLREQLEAEYDFVLIDSRTGLTDIGDVCTRVMPEKLVAVFVPNEQNLQGLFEIINSAAEHRINSRDPRPLMVYPLASRIDANAGRRRAIWRKGGRLDGGEIVGYEPRFEKLLQPIYKIESCDLDAYFDSTQVPHDSDYAFGERVAARDGGSDKLSIGRACENLARYLVDDRAPWERATNDQPTSSKASGAEAGLVLALQRVLLPAWLALIGIGLAIGLYYRDLQGPAVLRLAVGGIRTTSGPSSILGFGAQDLLLQIFQSSLGSSSPSALPPLRLKLDVSRGTISRNEIVITPGAVDTSARIKSAGFGVAQLTIEGFEVKGSLPAASQAKESDNPQNGPPPDLPASQVKESYDLYYTWPASLIGAVIGGALVGMAFRLWRLLRGPFGLPSAGTFVSFWAFDFRTSLLFGGLYIFGIMPLLDATYGYHLIGIFAAAGVAPHYSLEFLRGTVRIESEK
jgi:hypothetical protein